MKAKLLAYFWNIVIGFDQLANTFLAGYPDETFSARACRKAQAGQWFWRAMRWLINKIFFWQANHCYHAYVSEASFNHAPKKKRRAYYG